MGGVGALDRWAVGQGATAAVNIEVSGVCVCVCVYTHTYIHVIYVGLPNCLMYFD